MSEDEESIEEQAQREQDKQESKMDEYLNNTIVRQGKDILKKEARK